MSPTEPKTAQKERQTLISQNWRFIVPFVAAHGAIFYALTTGAENPLSFTGNALQSAAWATASGILAIILNGILSSNAKAILVFWRVRNPLPGCRAFTHILVSDPRIDPTVLRGRLGELPTDPDAQNRLWYRIYKKHEGESVVSDAHRHYLLTRDLASMGAVFLGTLGPLSVFLVGIDHRMMIYLGVLGVLYVSSALAARTYGKSFVANVLAAEASSE